MLIWRFESIDLLCGLYCENYFCNTVLSLSERLMAFLSKSLEEGHDGPWRNTTFRAFR